MAYKSPPSCTWEDLAAGAAFLELMLDNPAATSLEVPSTPLRRAALFLRWASTGRADVLIRIAGEIEGKLTMVAGLLRDREPNAAYRIWEFHDAPADLRELTDAAPGDIVFVSPTDEVPDWAAYLFKENTREFILSDGHFIIIGSPA